MGRALFTVVRYLVLVLCLLVVLSIVTLVGGLIGLQLAPGNEAGDSHGLVGAIVGSAFALPIAYWTVTRLAAWLDDGSDRRRADGEGKQ